MLEARTAWAIALLLAPTGLAAAGTMADVTAPAQHTAYVEIVIEEEARSDLASVEAFLACEGGGAIQDAIDWLADRRGCTAPAGAAIYVTRADAPAPEDPTTMVPTGMVYAYEDADRVWTVREYTYAGPGLEERHHAYVMFPDIADRVEGPQPGQPVRGVVDLDQLGVAPGEKVHLETTLAAAPQLVPEDPTIERVDASTTRPIQQASSAGLTG